MQQHVIAVFVVRRDLRKKLSNKFYKNLQSNGGGYLRAQVHLKNCNCRRNNRRLIIWYNWRLPRLLMKKLSFRGQFRRFISLLYYFLRHSKATWHYWQTFSLYWEMYFFVWRRQSSRFNIYADIAKSASYFITQKFGMWLT